jgi:nitroreductase
MEFSRPIAEIIKMRWSRRRYSSEVISPVETAEINAFLQAHRDGPFGSKLRFQLIAATDQNNQALNKLGTYGFINNPAGYIVGVVNTGPKSLEDFSYVLEKIVLKITDLGLDSCWIGATFAVNEFSRVINAAPGDVTPAVISLGYAPDSKGSFERLVRWGVQAHKRLPWEKLFLHPDFITPLSADEAGDFATPLEMVRIGPSASNRQPWRVVKENDFLWHLYLRRTRGYSEIMKTFNRADIQRLDMGIAMLHFEATCQEEGIAGEWVVDEPNMIKELPENTEYIASFRVSRVGSGKLRA